MRLLFSILIIPAGIASAWFLGSLAFDNWAARHGLDAQVDVKMGPFGIEAACPPDSRVWKDVGNGLVGCTPARWGQP